MRLKAFIRVSHPAQGGLARLPWTCDQDGGVIADQFVQLFFWRARYHEAQCGKYFIICQSELQIMKYKMTNENETYDIVITGGRVRLSWSVDLKIINWR